MCKKTLGQIMNTKETEKRLPGCEMIILIGFTNIEKKDLMYITNMRLGFQKHDLCKGLERNGRHI